VSNLPIWAQDKAREWLMTECAGHPDIYYPLFNSLAALLVEVANEAADKEAERWAEV
jgi:hypothetical protein